MRVSGMIFVVVVLNFTALPFTAELRIADVKLHGWGRDEQQCISIITHKTFFVSTGRSDFSAKIFVLKYK